MRPLLSDASEPQHAHGVVLAIVLSFGAAIALGITRFAYALVLPPMRADLQWSYAWAGALNALNAAGYLVGALSTARSLATVGAARALVVSAIVAALLMALPGAWFGDAALTAQRFAAGYASAWLFVAGGLLATRLAQRRPDHAGLLIGLYYGGTGLGIALSATLAPWAMQLAARTPRPWAWAWWVLAGVAFCLALALVATARHWRQLDASPAAASGAHPARVPVSRMVWLLAAYALFGLGYIGYMTFIVAQLRAMGLSDFQTAAFYTALGLACMVSPWLWRGLLNRRRDGRPFAGLNALLALATLMAAFGGHIAVSLASGLLFGAVFLSVVASTTAFVRHNLPQGDWPRGISAFTVAFAAGQVVGPGVVGWVSDRAGLSAGLLLSAGMLLLAAVLALRQKALAPG